MECSADNFKTPSNSRTVSRTSSFTSPQTKPTGQFIIPASPAMKKLGFGTGVSVFLYERFSPNRGSYGSPWAIKKISSMLKRQASASPEDDVLHKRPRLSPENSGSPVLFKRESMQDMCNSRLQAEASLLRTLSHPNIIGFRGYSTAIDGTKCLVMEAGERDLFSILENRLDAEDGPLDALHMHTVCLNVSRALQYLHEEHRLLHGDIKSANVLIKGSFAEVKLCDFGVCLKLDEKLTALTDQGYIGTECWSPPEVINDDAPVTDRADIFAFGLTIWECISLQPPHVHALTEELDEEQLSLEQQEELFELRDERFRKLLGTRPALPAMVDTLTGLYLPLLESFYHCTCALAQDRPSAAQLVQLFAGIVEEETPKEGSSGANKTVRQQGKVEPLQASNKQIPGNDNKRMCLKNSEKIVSKD